MATHTHTHTCCMKSTFSSNLLYDQSQFKIRTFHHPDLGKLMYEHIYIFVHGCLYIYIYIHMYHIHHIIQTITNLIYQYIYIYIIHNIYTFFQIAFLCDRWHTSHPNLVRPKIFRSAPDLVLLSHGEALGHSRLADHFDDGGGGGSTWICCGWESGDQPDKKEAADWSDWNIRCFFEIWHLRPWIVWSDFDHLQCCAFFWHLRY